MVVYRVCCLFFFKQKTAYEMRISDWSSEVCSSDLLTLEKVAGQTALLSGSLRLPETRYRIVREGAAQVPVLTGVRRKPPAGRQRISGDGLAAVGGSLFDLIRLDIALKAPDEIYVSGMGLESEIGSAHV